jgi:hypothetical protein
MPWYEVVLVVPPHPTNPLWRGWHAESNGHGQWEVAQVTALDVIMEIAQNFRDELGGGLAASIPRIAPAIEWAQDVGQNAHGALVRGRNERAQSDIMAMSAMMAVLKVNHDCQYTLSRVIDEAHRAKAAQHKYKKLARKLARALAMTRQEFEESKEIANYCLQQWGQVARERDALHDQLMNLTIEQDEAVQELDRVTRYRDAALELAKARRQARIQDHIHVMEMQNYLNEEGLVEIHHLNNERNPIPHPPPVYPDLGPQVIVAEDDGMEVDGPRVPAPVEVEEDEDEEFEPVSDKDGEAIFDANSEDDA